MPVDEMRAADWSEFIGQEALKNRLRVHISAALAEGRMLDHVLLCGPPGFGKTTLSHVIAQAMDDEPIVHITAPVREKELIKTILSFDGILVIDEIHRFSTKEQESLLPLLESGVFETTSGQQVGPCYLTVIGCTTERDKIIKPLWDRFTIKPPIEDYSDEDLMHIVLAMAAKTGVELSDDDAGVLARATAGVPRNARQFIVMARDLSHHHGRPATAQEVLAMTGFHQDGLTDEHVHYLQLLAKRGGTAGERALVSTLRLPSAVLLEVERLLFARNLITFTDRGRELTSEGWRRVRAART